MADNKVEVKQEPRRYILKEKRIDKFNVKKSRVLLTPAVCDICALDLMENNKLKGNYEALPEEMKIKLKLAVAEHKKAAHDASTMKIITEDQLPIAYLDELVVRKDAVEKLPDIYEKIGGDKREVKDIKWQ